MATGAAPEPQETSATGSVSPLSGLLVSAKSAKPRKLSEDLTLLLREFEVEAVTLREVMGVLHGRGYFLLLILLALPFCTPIPLPVLSTPFGFVIALIGLRFALGQKPWLPARLLDIKLPPRLFRRVFAAARKILSIFEYFLKPRLPWLTGTERRLRLHSVPIFLAAMLLLLPVPIPLSNTLPAFSILFLCAGLLERDGLFIIAGYLALLAAFVFFGVIAFAGAGSFDFIKNWLGS